VIMKGGMDALKKVGVPQEIKSGNRNNGKCHVVDKADEARHTESAGKLTGQESWRKKGKKTSFKRKDSKKKN